MEQVFLYNVDDLQAIVQENLSRRSSEIVHAEAIVSEEVERFGAWHRERLPHAPAIAAPCTSAIVACGSS